MANGGKGRSSRTRADLERAVRSIARHFKTTTVFIIGSQAALVGLANPPRLLTVSDEIDAWPENADAWAKTHDVPASEEINALFGFRSHFHNSFGFYIDGVDEHTAKMPPDWKARANVLIVEDGETKIRAVAPTLDDIVVSKLHRLDPKDEDFIATCVRAGLVSSMRVAALFEQTAPSDEIRKRAILFLGSVDQPPPNA